jgi:hypothetical protein
VSNLGDKDLSSFLRPRAGVAAPVPAPAPPAAPSAPSDPTPAPSAQRATEGVTWDKRHTRRNLHVREDTLAAMEAAAKEEGWKGASAAYERAAQEWLARRARRSGGAAS